MSKRTHPADSRWPAAILGLSGALVLAACASAPPPTAEIQAAKQAIDSAERADAGQHAPGELREARSRIASADEEVARKKMAMAARLAEEARAGADLATAKSSAVKAEAVNDEMKRSTAALVEEMRRTSGGTP
jgi:hypothetical protein